MTPHSDFCWTRTSSDYFHDYFDASSYRDDASETFVSYSSYDAKSGIHPDIHDVESIVFEL